MDLLKLLLKYAALVFIFKVRLFIQWNKTGGQIYRPSLTNPSALRKLLHLMKFEVSLQYESLIWNQQVLQNKQLNTVFVVAFPKKDPCEHSLTRQDDVCRRRPKLFSGVCWHSVLWPSGVTFNPWAVTLVVNGTMRPFEISDQVSGPHSCLYPCTITYDFLKLLENTPRDTG